MLIFGLKISAAATNRVNANIYTYIYYIFRAEGPKQRQGGKFSVFSDENLGNRGLK